MRRKQFKRFLWVALAAVIVLSNGVGYAINRASAAFADGSLTVAEAIAANSGTATVEGYIVGYATGSKTATYQAPFKDDNNILIADSPSEKDNAKVLDVQVTAAYRTAFGLNSNPDLIGRKVKVTGTLSAYNNFPGLKTPTGFAFSDGLDPVEPSPSPSPSPDPTPTPDPGTTPTLPDGHGKKVLFDNTHAQTAGAADWVIDGGFSDFADGLRADGFTVDSLDRPIPFTFGEQAITLDKLQQYDVFVMAEPNVPFKKTEQDAMLQYVQNGGSIFFIGDHYNSDRNKNRWDGSEAMNGYRRGAWDNPAKGMSAEEAGSPAMQGVVSSDWLADNFGIRFRYNALGDVDNLTDVVVPSQAFGITSGVGSVAMHAGSTLVILDPTKAKGLVYVPKNVPAWANRVDKGVYFGGRDEGPFAAVSKLGAGKAAFIGDSSPVEDPTPKYLREDTGAKKTTYDGFKGEADDAVFLVHTVEWLAHHESYTSLTQVPGLQLDSATKLLADGSEEPAKSTEPQPEPWAAPNAGYKWYDPTTFKSGSYGSSQQPPVQAQYQFVRQSQLPNTATFQIRVKADNLLPGQTVSSLSVGIYLTGGTQVAKIQNADGTWPSSYGYSSNFSLTADGTGHAYRDLNVQIDSAVSGAATLRLKVGSNNQISETVTIANVPAEQLPEDKPPVPNKVSIADARQVAEGSLVTVEGVITSEPGAFGGQAFYMQDSTAGVYVFQSATGYHAGDRISISAIKTTYNTEVELSDPVTLTKLGTAPIPAPIVQTELNDSNQGRLVTMKNAEIRNYVTATPTGSFEFDAGATHVRIDARTGISMADFQSKFLEGSIVSLTGISAIFKGVYQLKPLTMDAVTLEQSDRTAPSTTVLADGKTGENQYNNRNVTLTFAATDNEGGSGVGKTEYRVNDGAWTIAQGPVVIAEEGRNVVAFRSTDKAGNVEQEQHIAVWIDKTSPSVVFIGSTVFYPTDASIAFKATVTDNLSGVKSVGYTLDGVAIQSLSAISPANLSVGNHTLVVTAVDQAGNQTTVSATLTCGMDLDHLSTLVAWGEDHDLIKNHGTAQSLQSAIKNIQKAKNDSDRAKGLSQLADDIRQHTNKQIDSGFAQRLLEAVAYLQKH
ncbi:DUF6359 domain-containing protein [Cohnella terricola]|uniref:DUF6359 domain-containing protein n=1 Tax=Cohnella terricola TaxID=1289167 RepID=UPI00164495CE|nr:DUF6359 domain-containing protein [Cohnella terricola]